MSFLIGEISARVSADTSRFDSSISGVKRKGEQASRDLTKSFDKVGRGMRKTGAIMTASLTVPMVMGMRKAVQESALLEGALAKFDVVFGDMAEETRAWVEEFRSGVPLSRREIVQSAGALQDLLVPMGIAREEATGMTKDWMQLAAALGAFNDVPVDRALEAIRGGIAGEAEALRRFGIDVRVTAVEQRALAMGLIEAGEEMSEQVRQQALLAQAYANSKDAVDGYEDQLGTTLLTQQEMNAAWKDTLATIGRDLEPLYKSLMGTATDLMNSFQGLDESTRQNIIRMSLYTAAAGPMIAILGQMLIWTNRVNKAMKGLNATMLLNPWVAAAAGIGLVVTKIALAVRESKKFKEEMKDVLDMDVSGTDEELNLVNQQMGDISDKIQDLRRGMRDYNMEATRMEIEKLQDQARELAEMRDRIVENMQANNQASESADDFSESIDNLTESIRVLKPTIDAVEPMDRIFDPTDEVTARILAEEMERFNNALYLAATDSEDFSHRLDDTSDSAEETTDEMNKTAGAANQIGNALAQAVLHGKSLESVVKNLLKQMAARAFVVGIGSLLTGGASLGSKSFLSNVFGFAGGGNPPTGKVSLVGERGPELIAPRSASTVIPNHQLGGCTQKIMLNIRGVMTGQGSELRAVINESTYIDLS